MPLSAKSLVGVMAAAIKPKLKKHWKDASVLVQSESVKLAETLVTITRLKSTGRIDALQAQALLDMQKHSMKAVFLAVEGIGIIAAQNAINAALEAARDAVNKAIGFQLLPSPGS